MVKVAKLNREIRRILRKLPIVGRHVGFPTTTKSPPVTIFNNQNRLDKVVESFDAQLHALSGLKFCTAKHQARLVSHESRLDRMEASIQETIKQFERQHQILADRVEFSRKETLLELQRTRDPHSRLAGTSSIIAPEIVNTNLVNQQIAKGMLRLNMGCGHIPLSDYVNVDARKLPGVDLVADVSNLPFATASVSEIRSSHLLEHFRPKVLKEELLPYWHSLMVPGGTFIAIVPDATSMMRSYIAGEMSFEDIREVTFGSQEYDGNLHFSMFNSSTIADLLQEAGFEEISIVEDGRRNGLCLELEVKAVKPR